jgi:hypothetical protein
MLGNNDCQGQQLEGGDVKGNTRKIRPRPETAGGWLLIALFFARQL